MVLNRDSGHINDARTAQNTTLSHLQACGRGGFRPVSDKPEEVTVETEERKDEVEIFSDSRQHGSVAMW